MELKKIAIVFLFMRLSFGAECQLPEISFHNNSSFIIDSIVIEGGQVERTGVMRVGESRIVPFIEQHGMYSCRFKIYLSSLVFKGFCQRVSGQIDEKFKVFVHDNGISRENVPLLKPGIFTLVFYNGSTKVVNEIW